MTQQHHHANQPTDRRPRPKLSIEYMAVSSLAPDPQNSRIHSRRQLKQIAKSIDEFGFNSPLVVDANLQVICGHARLAASKFLGLSEVPVVRLEHLNEHQRRAFAIADNRLTENAAWDKQILADQLKILAEAGLDFSVEITGFEVSEINMMIEGAAPPRAGKEDRADSIPNSDASVQVTQTGDVWVLGRHRVLCGDSRDDHAYRALMNGRRANMVFADPPYNDPIDQYVTGFGSVHHREFAVASGELTEAEFTTFLEKTITAVARHSTNGSFHYFWMDWRHLLELLSAAQPVYSEFKNLCVWVKDSAGQGSFYRSQHELVCIFKNGKKPHCNNIQLGQFGRYRTNVWNYARANSLSSRNTEDGRLAKIHPTIKPVELVADALLDCTRRGDVVLDPFLGSGTTLIAAERTGRVCYGIELDPTYVDVIVRRWVAFTGLAAVHESKGRTFDEIGRERGGDRAMEQ